MTINPNKETVRILNPLQVYKYVKHGVKPIDIVADENTEKVMFIFTKEETRHLYTKWLNREL